MCFNVGEHLKQADLAEKKGSTDFISKVVNTKEDIKLVKHIKYIKLGVTESMAIWKSIARKLADTTGCSNEKGNNTGNVLETSIVESIPPGRREIKGKMVIRTELRVTRLVR